MKPLSFLLFALSSLAMDRTIQVSGDALVEVKPDFAVIRLNLESHDRLLKRARASHEADLTSVSQIVAKYKIAATDVERDFPEIETRADGFSVRRTVQFTLRQLDNYDAILFDLYDGAAVTVESVEFRVLDLKAHRNRARDLAIRAAEEKAQLMVSAMKRRIGVPVNVRVESNGGTLIRRRGFSDIRQAQMSQMNIAVSGSSATSGSELFRVPVGATVQVEYEILP